MVDGWRRYFDSDGAILCFEARVCGFDKTLDSTVLETRRAMERRDFGQLCPVIENTYSQPIIGSRPLFPLNSELSYRNRVSFRTSCPFKRRIPAL